MSDLRLDPQTNDIVMTGGRPEVVSDSDAKVQRIRSRLLMVRGEWFMDTTFGLDYRGVIWVKGTPPAVVAAHIKREILKGADSGDRITQFNYDFDSGERALSVTAVLEGAGGTTTTVSI